ncbi:hypothetical protein [Ferrimicrobium acidiphilum]|uniref:hypothetical protein n=1 Tax=Ferrimicrobium acidiphilum TaxID=121039 RepID=UPI0005548C5A|nr:hypothetical protein [Ferrimicrobium acidiphilum]
MNLSPNWITMIVMNPNSRLPGRVGRAITKQATEIQFAMATNRADQDAQIARHNIATTSYQ